MLDGQIRQAVRDELIAIHGKPPVTLLRDELGLCLGATRVDVAAVNGQLTGCEINGDRDRLSRLPHQVELYGRVLDVAVLITEPKCARKAVAHVPQWWGIWQVEERDGSARIEQVRQTGTNPGSDPLSVAQLLWRDEVYAELQAREAAASLARATR